MSTPHASTAASSTGRSDTDRSQEIAELLSRCALADRVAFKRLYDKTSSHLLGVILRITRNREIAEDLLQEVYVKVWHSAAAFDATLSQPLTWLGSIARHRAIDSLRRRQTQPLTVSTHAAGLDGEDDHDLLQGFASDDPGPLDLLERDGDVRALRGCLVKLSGEQKQAVALAFYQGHSYSEVAEHLSQPLGTVTSWVRRGLLSLKACLERAALQGS